MNIMFYLFNDYESGEEFFVMADSREEAKGIANTFFEEPQLVDIMTEEQSERYPYDVY